MAIAALALFSGTTLRAATTAETNAFYTARENFRLGFWPQAEKGFADFAKKYTNSEYYASAISFEAQALFQERRYTDAIYLLSTEQARAGALAEDFTWWTGQCQFALTNYTGAADTFGRLLKDYQASVRRLRAAVWQAKAFGKLQRWSRVIDILGRPDGEFQQLAKSSPGETDAITGFLRLAEAQLEQRDYPAAEQTLRNLGNQKLGGDDEWQRRYLLGRVQLSAGHTDEALQTCTNLLELTAASIGGDRRPETLALQAGALEQADRLPEAIGVYEQNLGTNAPAELRQEALLKIVELRIRQNDIGAATTSLELYLATFPTEKGSELALLTLGELQLRQYREAVNNARRPPDALAGAETNLLDQAITNFNTLITSSSNATYAGKAQLNLGWCLLSERKIAESELAFSNALAQLPFSEDQAVARFKFADSQYWRKDYGAAFANYRRVIDDYTNLPAVTNELFEPALYQMIRAALNQTNLPAAEEAMGHLLAWYPDHPSLEPSTLLLGQGLTRQGQATAARAMFESFITRAHDSPLAAEAQLAIARTFEAEGNWTNAIGCYDIWLAVHTNSPSRQKAEFAIAWANYAAGRETNALTLFTNFVARCPSNELAPLAQSWVADHYWRQQEFVESESNYKYVFQTWSNSPLAPRSRMWAGRSAYALEHISDAIEHFTNLTSRADLPLDIRLEAEFAYADALIKLSNYDRAIQVLKEITNSYPANSTAPLAAGRLGDCYFSLAGADPGHYSYDSAVTNYQSAMDSPLADISARSSAEVRLGKALEGKAGQAQSDADTSQELNLALRHYLNVVQGGNLRQGEKQDLYWVKEAGISAGELAEKLGQTAMTVGKATEAANQWQAELNLYQELRDLLPSMQQFWERKITRIQERLAASKGVLARSPP
jgi:TolA-binding protein/predicted negative regulator of RcsB-dependent stress response